MSLKFREQLNLHERFHESNLLIYPNRCTKMYLIKILFVPRLIWSIDVQTSNFLILSVLLFWHIQRMRIITCVDNIWLIFDRKSVLWLTFCLDAPLSGDQNTSNVLFYIQISAYKNAGRTTSRIPKEYQYTPAILISIIRSTSHI